MAAPPATSGDLRTPIGRLTKPLGAPFHARGKDIFTRTIKKNGIAVATGALLAWAAVLIQESSNSIVSVLVQISAMNLESERRNAITHSNLLLLGSRLSVPVLLVLFRRDLTAADLLVLTASDWKMTTLSAFLFPALTPGLFFYALAHTSVTKVVMIGRIEPPLFLLAAYF